jgi:hypothetical protein
MDFAEEIDRSLERITEEDLKKLAVIASNERQVFLRRNSRYRDCKLLCVALCQGAGLHYIDGKNGVKDFEVWTFYERVQQVPDFPARRIMHHDFGPSKFGRHPADSGYEGRRVDLLGRSIHVTGTNPIEAIRKYLSQARTKSARLLAKKAVVLIEPDYLIGTQVWPLQREPQAQSRPRTSCS